MELIIVTGMSGAGKSQVMETLEDMGYYCMDNMPPTLLGHFIDIIGTTDKENKKFAFVMDVRGGQLFGHLAEAIEIIEAKEIEHKIIFLEASYEVIMKRFDETKRTHPVTRKQVTLKDLNNEKHQLAEIRKKADIIIDTSKMRAYKLRNTIVEILEKGGNQKTFMINITSIGFKHGMPVSADIMYDVRFFPNPYYIASLKNLTGESKKIKDYVKETPEYTKFFNNITQNIDYIIPAYMREGKFHLNIVMACTGGKHRSVVLACELEEYYRKKGFNTTIDHRDITKA